MARFVPLLKGPVIEADTKKEAELLAAQRHGDHVARVESLLELELDREAQQAIARRKPREP